jgi:RepB DNA-primase from phage plasmid
MTNINMPQASSCSTIIGKIENLSSPAFYLLKTLVEQMKDASLDVTTPISELAALMHKTDKSVHNALRSLKDAGLVQRIELKGMFKPYVTRLVSHDVANYFKQPQLRQKSGQKRPPPIRKGDAEFDYLMNPERNSKVDADIESALSNAAQYWSYIADGFATINFCGKLQACMQSRSRRSGSRTGPHKNRHSYSSAANANSSMRKYARYAFTANTEASFRIDGPFNPLLLVDDLSAEALDHLPSSYAILETSPGNFQASIMSPRVLTPQEYLVAQDGLLLSLGGDEGAKGFQQLRRMPGSVNRKPELVETFVTKVHKVSANKTISDEELNDLIRLGNSVRAANEQVIPVGPASTGKGGVVESHLERGGFNTLSEPTAVPRGDRAADHSGSGKDFGKAIELLHKNVPHETIVEKIAQLAVDRNKYGGGTESSLVKAYAKRTVEKARLKYDPVFYRKAAQFRIGSASAVSSNELVRN